MPKRTYSQINKEDNLYFNKRHREEPVIEEDPEPVQEVLDILGGGDSVTVRDNHIYFYSEVNRDSIYELGELMKEIEEENKKSHPRGINYKEQIITNNRQIEFHKNIQILNG